MRDHHVALDIQARDLNCRSSSNILLYVILIVMNPQALYTTIIMHICVCTAWMSNPIVRFETDSRTFQGCPMFHSRRKNGRI